MILGRKTLGKLGIAQHPYTLPQDWIWAETARFTTDFYVRVMEIAADKTEAQDGVGLLVGQDVRLKAINSIRPDANRRPNVAINVSRTVSTE